MGSASLNTAIENGRIAMVNRASKFQIEDAQISNPLCHGCKHWIKDSLKCAAFPHGIPLGIMGFSTKRPRTE